MDFITLQPEQLEAFRPLLPEEFERSLAEEPEVLALGAVEERLPAGVLVFALEPAQIRMTWLCVAEENRGRGVARALVRRLEKQARRDPEASRIFADVPKSSPLNPAFTLLLTEGWMPVPFSMRSCSCTLARLSEGEFWQRDMSEAGVHPLSQISEPMLRAYSSLLEEESAPVELPLRPENCDPDVSMGYVKDGRLLGCILLASREDGLDLFFAHARQEAREGVARLFHAAQRRAAAKYPPETRLSLAALTPEAARLAERLIPCVRQPMYRMSRYLIHTGKEETSHE